MALRVPVHRLVATNVENRVAFTEDEVSLAPSSVEGQQSITLWRCDRPRSGFFVTKFAPGLSAPFHRPMSINYMYVIEGEIEYAAQNGGVVRLKAGDYFVANEIDHGWRTPPDSHAVICTVMVYTDGEAAGQQKSSA